VKEMNYWTLILGLEELSEEEYHKLKTKED